MQNKRHHAVGRFAKVGNYASYSRYVGSQHLTIKFLATLPDEPTRAYGEKLLHAVKTMFKATHRHETLTPQAFQAALEQAKARIIHISLSRCWG